MAPLSADAPSRRARPLARGAHGPATLAALTLCVASVLSAHGDLHEQIAAASRAIARQPRDAALYLARGELYRAHHDATPALADYATALRLNPTLDAAHLARGRLLMEANRAAEALPDLDRFLARRPDHADALVVRARARAAVGDAPHARADYDRALSLAPNPDWFIERARLVRPSAGPAAAIDGLDEGLARLGPLLTLTLEAIDCELSLGHHDAALARLDRLVAASGPHPQWTLQRADILLAAGREKDARDAFSTALDEIDALSPARRRTRQNDALRARATSALVHLDTMTRNP
jgi:predicted Zn-dependent protease